MRNKTTKERLRELMNIFGINQSDIVNRTLLPKSAISQYVNGTRVPRQDKLSIIADAYGVDPAWLMGYDVPMRPVSKNNGTLIPVLGRVAAGIPIEAAENIIDYEEISDEMAKRGEFFALQIKGDSMEPDIHDGDTVICKKQDTAESGQIVIALVNGHDGVCKRLMMYSNALALVSLNPSYEPMYFSEEQIGSLPVSICGVVVELRRRF